MWNLNEYIYESKEQLWDKSDFDFFSVTNNQWLVLSEKRVSEDTSKYKKLKNNYFAYNPYRINVWSIWIFKWEKWAVSPAYVVFYVDDTKIFPDLLFLLLKSNYFILEINKNTKWSVRDALSFNKFKNIEFTFPEDIEEQKRLFKKLESINGKIAKIKLSKEKNNIKILREQILKQAIEWKLVKQNPDDEPVNILLEKIKQEKEKLIKEWKLKKEKELAKITEDEIPFEIPGNWAWCRLKEILIFNPKNNLNDDLDVSFIPMKLIQDWYSNKHFNEKRKWKDIKKWFTHFAEWDIVFAKITPCFENKKSAIMQNLINWYWAWTTELIVLRIFENLLISKLFLSYFKSDTFIKLWINSFTWTAWQQRVNLEEIKNSLFPLPPLEEQKRIVEKIEEFEVKLNKLDKLQTKQLKELEVLKNSVLDKALSGELI